MAGLQLQPSVLQCSRFRAELAVHRPSVQLCFGAFWKLPAGSDIQVADALDQKWRSPIEGVG